MRPRRDKRKKKHKQKHYYVCYLDRKQVKSGPERGVGSRGAFRHRGTRGS